MQQLAPCKIPNAAAVKRVEQHAFRFSHLMLSVLIPDGMNASHLNTLMVSHVMSLKYRSTHLLKTSQ